MKNDGFKIMSGFFIGAIGGLLTGILIAPESGKDTRKKISDTANKIKDDLSDFADETLEATKKSISETIDELVENGKEQSKKILKN
jgi:gas vesicle protein